MPAGWLDRISTRALRNVAVLLGAVLAIALVALILSIENRVHQVPQVARNTARQQARFISREQTDRRTEATLRAAGLAACGRQNGLYIYLNHQTGHEYAATIRAYRSAAATYAALHYVGELERRLTRVPGPAHGRKRRHRIERLSAQKILRAADRDRANARASRRAARRMQYLPLADCQKLISHPDTYRSPPTISWTQHLALQAASKP